jgi:hypothetical protein
VAAEGGKEPAGMNTLFLAHVGIEALVIGGGFWFLWRQLQELRTKVDPIVRDNVDLAQYVSLLEKTHAEVINQQQAVMTQQQATIAELGAKVEKQRGEIVALAKHLNELTRTHNALSAVVGQHKQELDGVKAATVTTAVSGPISTITDQRERPSRQTQAETDRLERRREQQEDRRRRDREREEREEREAEEEAEEQRRAKQQRQAQKKREEQRLRDEEEAAAAAAAEDRRRRRAPKPAAKPVPAAETESDDAADAADDAPKRPVPPPAPLPADEVPVRPGGKSIKELAEELKRDAGASDGEGADDD